MYGKSDKTDGEKTNEEVLRTVKRKLRFIDAIRAGHWKTTRPAARRPEELHNIMVEGRALRFQNSSIEQIENNAKIKTFRNL